MDNYQYDVFLSYTRKPPVGEWVQNHFHPLLNTWLSNHLGKDARIFRDVELETGTHWPEALQEAHRRSKILVAVWSPPYFSDSRWCMAEWISMRQREKELGLASGLKPGLVYPVVFSDGDRFPDEAKTTTWKNLSNFNTPYRQFRKTKKYVDFDKIMQEVAQELLIRIENSPDWEPDWPIMHPDPQQSGELPLPRIQ